MRALTLPRVPVLWALTRREYLIARSYRMAFALGLAFGALNLAVYFYISRTLPAPAPAALDGAPSFFAFAAAGIAVGLVVQTAASGLARRLREEQLTGALEAIVVQPVSSLELGLGLSSFPFAFAVLRAAGYLAFAALVLGLALGDADAVGVVVVLALTAPALAGVGIAVGAAVLVFKRADAVVAVAAFALSFVSGAYFPVEELPAPLPAIAELTPTYHALEGLRAALFAGGGWGGHSLLLVLFAVVTLPLGALLFRAALLRARRTGTLGQV